MHFYNLCIILVKASRITLHLAIASDLISVYLSGERSKRYRDSKNRKRQQNNDFDAGGSLYFLRRKKRNKIRMFCCVLGIKYRAGKPL